MGLGNSALARVLGFDFAYRNFNIGEAVSLPQKLGVIGQGNSATTYSTDPYIANSSGGVATRFGFGSPLHLASRQLFPANNDGIGGIPVTIYPLVDDAAGVPADGSIDLSGTSTEAGTDVVYVGGISSEQFTIPSGTAADDVLALIKTAIDSVLEMPALTGTVAAGVLPLDAKWDGESGNDISIDVSHLSIAGLTFSTTPMASGAANPDVDDALVKIVNVWETMLLNCLNYDDVTTLGKYSVWGEGRWNNQIRRIAMVASGSIDNFATRTAITDAAAQKADRTGFLVQSIASRELPWVIAARGLTRIMPIANKTPARGYIGKLSGLQAGADASQETYTIMNNAFKLGASTNIKPGNVAELQDTITFYHPDGETPPPYRYVADITKLANISFNIDLIFNTDEWKGATLLRDEDVTTATDVKQPKDARTALGNLADSLLDRFAIITDAEFTKNNLTAAIDGTNPKRLNWAFPVKISGNTEVISGDVFFGLS